MYITFLGLPTDDFMYECMQQERKENKGIIVKNNKQKSERLFVLTTVNYKPFFKIFVL